MIRRVVAHTFLGYTNILHVWDRITWDSQLRPRFCYTARDKVFVWT